MKIRSRRRYGLDCMGKEERMVQKKKDRQRTEEKKISIGIIGGGASGLMAAVSAALAAAGQLVEAAAQPGEAYRQSGGRREKGVQGRIRIVILEKKDRVGKKILATGNGRCNLTNLDFDLEHLDRYYRGGDVERLAGYFERFGVKEALELFDSMGMLVMDRNGYVYPRSQQAATVLDVLRFELERLGVELKTECGITKIEALEGGKGGFLVRMGKESLFFHKLILSCGGPAGERQGGMDGFQYAADLGHHVTPLFPALVQLRCKGDFWKSLAGVRTEAALEMEVAEKRDRPVGEGRTGNCQARLYRERGEVQLTDYGISGIPVFQLSRYAAQALAQGGDVRVRLDFLPEYLEGREWKDWCQRRIGTYEGRPVEELFAGLVNKKILQTLMRLHGLKAETVLGSGERQAVWAVLMKLRSFPLRVSAANPFVNAQVCAGGVPLRQVTGEMESRVCPGLYLAGELLDVDGICGGYNLQWAWTSGYLAGRAAARSCLPAGR